MKKKILAFLMALVITAGMMPYACAAAEGVGRNIAFIVKSSVL
jgi:predicted small secreted protein